MEIGSGLGYVLHAAVRRYKPRLAIGLDVAPSMIEKAKARLARDDVVDARMQFLLYDGLTIPLAENGIDYVFSVASLQHVPKVYVYVQSSSDGISAPDFRARGHQPDRSETIRARRSDAIQPHVFQRHRAAAPPGHVRIPCVSRIS
jgi:SAM-dependent methyltransferase